MDEQTPRPKPPNQNKTSPEATEAGAEPPSGSRILDQDDRWMSKPHALIPKKTKPPPKPPRQHAEPLQALESSVTMTDG